MVLQMVGDPIFILALDVEFGSGRGDLGDIKGGRRKTGFANAEKRDVGILKGRFSTLIWHCN
jgi:hypothetical protein